MIKEIIIVSYIVIAILSFAYEYYDVKKECSKTQHPKFDYCFIRGIFFPLVWIKKICDYIF